MSSQQNYKTFTVSGSTMTVATGSTMTVATGSTMTVTTGSTMTLSYWFPNC